MIVLDTHVWIWWLDNPAELSETAKEAIQTARQSNDIYISSMSVWELNMLVTKARLQLKQSPQDWLKHSEGLSFIQFVPINNQIAQNSVHLDLHPDPADRIICATAMYLGATLISKDNRLQAFKEVKTLW